MEDEFRNLTAKVWANLDNPLKRYHFSKVSLILCMSPSQVALLISVMSQQYNCLMELYTYFYKILLFMNMYLPSSFVLRYVWAEMNVHAFMNELDQKDYWYPRKIKNCENLCTKSMESWPLVISHILAEFHPERATYTTLHNHFSKSAQTFTVGFVKLLSTHTIHIVAWGNFPFNNQCTFFSPAGAIKAEIHNRKGQPISRLPGSQHNSKKLLVELKIIWHCEFSS